MAMESTLVFAGFLCMLSVSVVSAFECPHVRNQLLIADPDDCRKYYHCLSGGRVYVKSCPKGLVFDPRQKVCVWDSATSCLTARQKQEEDTENLIETRPQLPHKKVHQKIKPVAKTTRRKVRTTTTTTTRRPTTSTTTTTQATTSTTEPTTEPATHELLSFDESVKIGENEMMNGGDYPDMAFDITDNTVDVNDNTTTPDLDSDDIQSGDSAAKQTSGSLDLQGTSSLDDYSSFLFFPNRRLVKRAPGPEPEPFQFKIVCPNAFAYVVEPDNCDTFYHCNNWKPFLKRCPPGLYFDATNLVCNWPHNVNCFAGKRANTFFAFNQLRNEKFSNVPKKRRMRPKGEEYKVKAISKATTTAQTTSDPTLSPDTTTKTSKTTLAKSTTSMPEYSTTDSVVEVTTDRKSGSIFEKKKINKKSFTEDSTSSLTETTPSGEPEMKTTRVNRYMRNYIQRNGYLFGNNQKRTTANDNIEIKPSVRPTLRSKSQYRNTMRYTSAHDDSPRLNPFTRPSYEKLEALRSRNIHHKNKPKEVKGARPSIILVDNTPIGGETTVPRDVKDKSRKLKNLPSGKPLSTQYKSTSATFHTSTVDYSATSPNEEEVTTSFLASSSKRGSSQTTSPPETTTEAEIATGNIFEASSTDSTVTVRAVQYANKPINITSNMTIEQALSNLEPSKHIPKSSKVDIKMETTTDSMAATDMSTAESSKPVSFFTTSNTTESLGLGTDNSTSANDTVNDATTVITISDFLSLNDSTEASNATTNATETGVSTLTEGVVLLNTSTITLNDTLDFNNDTLPVNVSSFRANLEDLMDTYHANYDSVDLKPSHKDDGSKHSFDAGTNDTYQHDTDTSGSVSFTARTTDRSAMMVQKQQGVKDEVQIDKFMIKMLNNAFDPQQSPDDRDGQELSEQDNMVDGDMSDNPDNLDKSYKSKPEKWMLYGNSEKKDKKNKLGKMDSRFVKSETVEDKKNDDSVIEEDLISTKNQEMFVENNSINGFDNVESSGDIDNFHNSILLDNTNSETRLLKYASSEEESDTNIRSQNFFDAPISNENDKIAESNTTSSNSTGEDDKDEQAIRNSTVVQDVKDVNGSHVVTTTTVVNDVTTAADVKHSTDDSKKAPETATIKNSKPTQSTEKEATDVPEIKSSVSPSAIVSSTSSSDATTTTASISTDKQTTAVVGKSDNNTTNTTEDSVASLGKNLEESKNGTELLMNDEADKSKKIELVEIKPMAKQTSTETSKSQATTKEDPSTKTTTAIPSENLGNDTADTVTDKTTSNVTEGSVVSNATDTVMSKATMRSVKSVGGDTVVVSKIPAIANADKASENKKSFISLSDLIKWYLRHWKNYSQWKGGKMPETEGVEAS